MIINQGKDGGVIVYNSDDFIGLVSGYGSGNYPKAGKGASNQVAINPFREATPGILAPAFTTLSLNNAYGAIVSTIVRNVTTNRDTAQPNAWLIETGANVHQIAGSAGIIGNTISVTAPFPHTLVAQGIHATHTAPVLEDIAVFTIGSSTSVFYSYNDNTDGDVGRVDTTPDGFVETWFTGQAAESALSGTVPHPMLVGDDDQLYIADGRALRFVSNTGAFSSTSSVVPIGFTITSLTKTGTYLVVFADRSKGTNAASSALGSAVAIFWNYGSQSADYVYDLNDNEVSAGFNFGGIIGCFTHGRLNDMANIGYTSKVRFFENGKFVPKFSFTQAEVGTTYIGSRSDPTFGGWDIHSGMLWWNAGGTIYSYGSPYPDLPARFNRISAGSGSAIGGFVKSLNGTDLYIGSDSGTGTERILNGNTYLGTSSWKGLVAEPIFPTRNKGKIDRIEVGFYGSATGGRTMTLTLDTDYGNATTTILNAVDTITAGTQILTREWDISSNSLPYFAAVKPQVSWAAGAGAGAAPKISYIKIYYSFSEVTY